MYKVHHVYILLYSAPLRISLKLSLFTRCDVSVSGVREEVFVIFQEIVLQKTLGISSYE